MRRSNLGRKPSEESRRKMSEAQRRRRAWPPAAGRPWTPEEDAIVLSQKTNDAAKLTSRTIGAVRDRRRKLTGTRS
jgi:hypothetical protein